MRIEENKVYMFTFDTGEMGNIAIPIRAESREQAATNLQNMFARMQTELAMEFPKVSVPAGELGQGNPVPVTSAEGLSEILIERIDKLMTDLGGGALATKAKAETIKNWTDLKFSPENYSAIVKELELIVSGQKEVPVKGKDK